MSRRALRSVTTTFTTLALACGGPTTIAVPPPPPPPPGPDAAIGWELLEQSPERDGRYDDVFFLDADRGWLFDTGGDVHRTADGGATWELVFSDPTITFRAGGMATAQLGWAGSLNAFRDPMPNSSLYETTDAGDTWTNINDRVTGPEPVGICGMFVVDENTVFAAGRWHGPAVFVRTRDGGATWESFDMSAHATGLVDVHFFDADRGLIIGGDGVGPEPDQQASSDTVILLTEDGGDTWEVVHRSDIEGTWGWKFSFPTSQIGYAAIQGPADAGIVLKTGDAGETWTALQVAEDIGFSGIGFATDDVGWVGGHSGTYQTTDGGQTWSPVELGEALNRFRMLSPDLGYASGLRVHRFTGLP